MGLLNFEEMMQNPLLQAGLGILANNNSRNAGQVIGNGLMQGFGNVAQYQQALQRKKSLEEETAMRQKELAMRKQQFDIERERYDQEKVRRKKVEDWASSYGVPNAEAVSSGGYAPALQGSDAPNFNMVKQPDVVTPNGKFDSDAWLRAGIAAGGISPIELIKMQEKDNTPITVADGATVIGKDGKILFSNPKDGNEKLPDMVRQFQWARDNNGYKGTFEQFKQIGALNPVALSQLAIAQGGLDLRQREADYTLPARPKANSSKLPKSKLFKLDGGGSVAGTLDPSVGKYYVIQNGKKHWVEE